MSIKSYFVEGNVNDISLFGKSYKWQNGDIVIDTKTKNPVMITGVDNLIQTVERALSISRGTHLFYENIGLSVRDIFDIQKNVSRREFNDYTAILVQEAIAASTPFYEMLRDIKVQRSEKDERKLQISVVLELDQVRFGINIVTDISKVI